jgi:pimeloyl-ACP methyl ester carboxylesterase
VAAGRDPITDNVSKAELRVFVSPFGFRRGSRVRPDELRRLAVPTLVIWGEYEPLGGVSVANRTSARPSISRDGRFVAFDSVASNLVPADTNGIDVLVHQEF